MTEVIIEILFFVKPGLCLQPAVDGYGHMPSLFLRIQKVCIFAYLPFVHLQPIMWTNSQVVRKCSLY